MTGRTGGRGESATAVQPEDGGAADRQVLDGRPPGSRPLRSLPVPAGVERVLLIAATDGAFRLSLLDDPRAAVRTRGLLLREAELAVLCAVPKARLQSVIEGLDLSQLNLRRRSFLRAVAVSAAAVATGQPTSGCNVEASGPPLITRVLDARSDKPVDFSGEVTSELLIRCDDDVIHEVSVKLHLQIDDSRGLRVYLTSPSGTRVSLVDRSSQERPAPAILRGWFGRLGRQTAEPLTGFSGEPAGGPWTLTVSNEQGGRLVSWILSSEVVASTVMVGVPTYGGYGCNGDTQGCDCTVATPHGK